MENSIIPFFDFTILPQLHSTKKYFEETLTQLEHKFTSTYNFSDSFSIMMKKSFLITTYSLLEKQLSILTILVEENAKTDLKLVDLKHRGIYRDYTYLIKVAGIAPPAELWKKIKIYNKIRNYFIHDIRKVVKQKDVIKMSNKAVPYINFEKEGKKDRYVIKEIDSNIIVDFLDTVEAFLKVLWVEAHRKGYLS